MLDLIFENQLILFSIAASVLPMVFSLLIVFGTVIAHGIQVRQEKKQEERRKAQMIALRREKKRKQRMLEIREEERQGGVSLGGVIPQEQPSAEATAEAEQSGEAQPDGAMQDILSSVFADDEDGPRYELLLRDKQPVHIAELESLAEQVSAGLRAQLGGLAS